MEKRYLILPMLFSLILYLGVIGIILVNLCDYSDAVDIVFSYGLIIFLAAVFKIFVVIPYTIFWWTAAFFCNDFEPMVILTGITVTATFVASIAYQIFVKNEITFKYVFTCVIISFIAPPTALIFGTITILTVFYKLISEKK